MKKITIKLAIAAISLLILNTGCNNDFLEKPSGGTVTSDTIFNTRSQARQAIAQMYNTCVTSYFPNSKGDGLLNGRPDALTDEVDMSQDVIGWCGSIMNLDLFVKGSMSTEKPCDWGGYGSHYNGIRHANLVYKNIDQVKDADDAWKKDIKGQALFYRALQHFELFRYYGGIPLIDHPIEEDVLHSRASLERTVNAIVSWCDEAASLMQTTRPTTDFGMATKLAALALKSRVLLYAASPLYNTPDNLKSEVAGARFGDARDSVLCYPTYSNDRWKLAADAAQAVIENAALAGVSLYNTGKISTNGDTYATLGDYESVWNVYANQEIILSCTTLTTNAWDEWKISKAPNAGWATKNNTPIEFAQLYEKNDGSKWIFNISGTDLTTYLEGLNLDPRFYQSIAYDGKWYSSSYGKLDYYLAGNTGANGKCSGIDGYAMEAYKFQIRVDNQSDNHIVWPVFRLAEFYLSKAEALNEYNNGPSADAYDAMNLIRSRVGMPAKSGLDVNSFRDAIQNERTIELAFENHRYNDILRWLKGSTILNQNLHVAQTTGNLVNGEVLHPWTIVQSTQRSFPKKYYYVPFTNAEISKNYLGDGKTWNGQNPGW